MQVKVAEGQEAKVGKLLAVFCWCVATLRFVDSAAGVPSVSLEFRRCTFLVLRHSISWCHALHYVMT